MKVVGERAEEQGGTGRAKSRGRSQNTICMRAGAQKKSIGGVGGGRSAKRTEALVPTRVSSGLFGHLTMETLALTL